MSSYTKNFRNTTRAAFGTAPDCSTPLPFGFDPQQHPILSRHWFGVEPCANARQAVFDAPRVEPADLIGREAA